MQQSGVNNAALLAAQAALIEIGRRSSRVTIETASRSRRGRWGQGRALTVLVSGASAVAPKAVLCEGVESKEEEKDKTSFAKIILDGMIAGAAAGSSVEAALYPIDTIKTRLQVARAGGGINFSGLYSGVWGNLAGVIPASALFVGVYEPLKGKLLEMLPPDLSVAAHLTAGAAGGLAASFVRVPTEVIKQRLQTGQFTGLASAVKSILAQEGVRGLYAGYGSFLLRDLPFDALQFAIYEQLKVGLSKAANRPLKEPEMAVVGAVAGALTGAVTTPLDVIKTRLMTQGTSMQYKGIIDCITKITAEEGAIAFCRGMTPRVIWIGIGGSIFFGVFERVKRLLATPPTTS